MLLIAGVLLICFAIGQLLWVLWSAPSVPRPEPVQEVRKLGGSGQELAYVVMGDSTAVSQGGIYAKGYAMATAEHLAQTRQVRLTNTAIPGARAKDVLEKQLPQAIESNPDVVLVAVGANDVTHLTPPRSVAFDLTVMIDALRSVKPDVKIILTGAPDMGSVPRFPQPLRWLAGWQTERVNAPLRALAAEKKVVFAPIAKETGPVFRQRPELFAPDKFHPTTEGYELWTPVLLQALHDAGYTTPQTEK